MLTRDEYRYYVLLLVCFHLELVSHVVKGYLTLVPNICWHNRNANTINCSGFKLLNSVYSMQLNRSIPNLRAADTIKSRLNLVHGNLSKVSLHMRLKQLRQGQTSAI